jgi:hypothetical protein
MFARMRSTLHARTPKKKKIFVKFIELIRSIQNLFEFCKSDENWAQLQALKLRSFHVLIFWCSSLTYLFFFLCVPQAKKNKYASEEHQEHQNLRTSTEHQKISTSKLVTEFSFHLICKIQTHSECYESAQ